MENYNKYKVATEKADWRAICEINGVSFDALGTQKELAVLPNYLEPGEIVFALTSGLMEQTVTSNAFDFGANTWLAVLTSDRFLFLDAALLTSSVDTQSIRLKNVQAISASQGFILGKIMIDLGSRIVVVDNCTKESVKVMAELGNRWIKDLENGFVPPKENPDMADFKKKVNEDSVTPSISEGPVISRTSAAIVTGLFEWCGLNDFIWGRWSVGLSKCGVIELSFPKQHAKEMKTIRKGDGLIANCIGRGLSLGTYSADKCSVKGVYKKDQLRK